MTKRKYFHLRGAFKRMRESSFCSVPVARRRPGDEYGDVVAPDFANTIITHDGSFDPINLYKITMIPALTINAAMKIKYAIYLLSKLRRGRSLLVDHNEIVRFVALHDLVSPYSQIVNPPQRGTSS